MKIKGEQHSVLASANSCLIQSLQETSNCLWEEVPIESGHQVCPLGEREARPRRLPLAGLHLHETSRTGAGGWSTEAESSPAVARGLEGGWGGTADGHRVYFREMKMTQN